MNKPNIIFLIWDACRADHVEEYAETFSELAAANIRFERAVAPATWSLPSHASLFSGRPPHQHGVTADPNTLDRAESLTELGEKGYTRYGVSATGFTAGNIVAREVFDEFKYTLSRMRPGALDVRALSQELPQPCGVAEKSPNSVVCCDTRRHTTIRSEVFARSRVLCTITNFSVGSVVSGTTILC